MLCQYYTMIDKVLQETRKPCVATRKEVANIAYDAITNGDFSRYETLVRQYVVNGMTESDAKKKAALELGRQVVEASASSVIDLDSVISLKHLLRGH